MSNRWAKGKPVSPTTQATGPHDRNHPRDRIIKQCLVVILLYMVCGRAEKRAAEATAAKKYIQEEEGLGSGWGSWAVVSRPLECDDVLFSHRRRGRRGG
jgi:hypothetical protein